MTTKAYNYYNIPFKSEDWRPLRFAPSPKIVIIIEHFSSIPSCVLKTAFRCCYFFCWETLRTLVNHTDSPMTQKLESVLLLSTWRTTTLGGHAGWSKGIPAAVMVRHKLEKFWTHRTLIHLWWNSHSPGISVLSKYKQLLFYDNVFS